MEEGEICSIPLGEYQESYKQPVRCEYIFGSVEDQQQVISTLMLTEETILHMKQHLSPGGVCSQDLCKFITSLDYAADNTLLRTS